MWLRARRKCTFVLSPFLSLQVAHMTNFTFLSGAASRPIHRPSVLSRSISSIPCATNAFVSPLAALSRPRWIARPGQSPSSPSVTSLSIRAATTEAEVSEPSTTAVTTKSPPIMDYTTLFAVASSVQAAGWVPARIEGVVQSDPHTVVLRLRSMAGLGQLYISWHPQHSRVCMGDAPTRGALSESFSLGEQLQQRLGNHILTAIDLPQPWERVVRLSLAPRLSEPPTLHLYAEVMGKHSNLVLVDAKDDAILVCGQQISSKQSRLRQLHIGDTYRLPPPALGAAPSLTEPQDRWTQNLQSAFELLAKERQRSPSLPEVLARAYQGVSPALARELAAAAGLPADVQASRAMYYEEPLDALFAEWQRWLRTLAAKSFAPGRTPEGAYSVLGGTLESDPDAPDLQERVGSDVTAGPSGRAAAPSPNALVPLPPLLAMIAAEYHSFEGERQFGTQRRDLEKAVTAAIRKVENRLRAFELQVVGAAAADEVQHQGDLLVASMWQIKPGMESLEVDDWTTGQKVTLQLDPKKKPQEQAEEFFKKARKLRRGADQVAALAEEAARQLEYLRGVELSLQQLGSAATTIDASGAGAEAGSEPEREDMLALLEIQEELIAGGFMKARPEASLTGKAMLKAKKGAGKAQKGPESGLRTFTSPGGFRVLVGRNNRQNDELSLKICKDADWWFHAQGCPGAHVVLRVKDKSDDVPEPDLRFAASLAAYFSKARNADRFAVSMIKAGNVRKPRGAPPGMVTLTAPHKTILGFPPEVQALGGASEESG